jgi:ferredoxin
MPKVTFKKTNQTVDTAPGKMLKEIIKEQGWPVAFGCEGGVCGTCLIKISEGAENLNPIEGNEKQTLSAMGLEDGTHRLACQCKVNGDITIEV